jgi:copper oxidase (laccase) domain-containing protein
MSTEARIQPYEVVPDEFSVWQQGNAQAGDTFMGTCEGWETNLTKALDNLAKFTTARQVIRISAAGQTVDLVDMDRSPKPHSLTSPLRTEGIITSNPAHVLFANPADCGEIAVSAVTAEGHPVIGLLHASRAQVDRKSYLRSLEYLCISRRIGAEDLAVRISPSARAESYVFDDISAAQKAAARWRGYVEQDTAGRWHVDFHNRTLDDLRDFGIKEEQMFVSQGDTAHPDSPYFSYSQSVRGVKPDGGNGLLFALRGL